MAQAMAGIESCPNFCRERRQWGVSRLISRTEMAKVEPTGFGAPQVKRGGPDA
jgi:hypothetical protein